MGHTDAGVVPSPQSECGCHRGNLEAGGTAGKAEGCTGRGGERQEAVHTIAPAYPELLLCTSLCPDFINMQFLSLNNGRLPAVNLSGGPSRSFILLTPFFQLWEKPVPCFLFDYCAYLSVDWGGITDDVLRGTMDSERT